MNESNMPSNEVVVANETPIVNETASESTATAEKPETKAQRKARRKAETAKKAQQQAKAKRKSSAEHFATIKPTQHDSWGCRIGSASAVIDGVLQRAKVPMTVKEIHDACKGKGRATEGATRQHIISRLKRGQVKLKDGAYIAVRKPSKAQASETSESAD